MPTKDPLKRARLKIQLDSIKASRLKSKPTGVRNVHCPVRSYGANASSPVVVGFGGDRTNENAHGKSGKKEILENQKNNKVLLFLWFLMF